MRNEQLAKAATREELEYVYVLAEIAKHELRAAGFGVTGMDLLDTVREVIANQQGRGG